MDTETSAPKTKLKQVRVLLWILVALALAGAIALLAWPKAPGDTPGLALEGGKQFGGPFTLVGADGKPSSTQRLEGKPYAISFGFTRCGDVCPTTLARLAKLRREAASDEALNIVFVTIDPENDGPDEVGQYAKLFNAPIIGLTGSPAQIDQVKKQYGIFAQPVPHAAPGQQMQHTSTVLLFDRGGNFVATIAADEPDSSALQKMKKVTA